MKTILIIAGVVWLFWNMGFRQAFISVKYKKPKAIPFSAELDKEGVYRLLSEKLKYPTQKALYYDENGTITLECKYGRHAIAMKDGSLYVGRDSSHNAKNTEEAECLDAYIRKLFDVDAPVNPYDKFKRMNAHKRTWLAVQAVMVLACVIAFALGAKEAGLDDAAASGGISTSYLTEYSQTVTIGDAFDQFFGGGKWSSFSDGAIKYVDYSGTCTLDDEPASAVVRFWSSGTAFRVDSVMLNGVELPAIGQTMLLKAVYESASA